MNLLKNFIFALFALTIAVSFGFYLGKDQPSDRTGQLVQQAARNPLQQPSPPRVSPHHSAAPIEQVEPPTVEPTIKIVSNTEPTPIDPPAGENTDTQWARSHEHDVMPIEEPEWQAEPEGDSERLSDGQELQEQKLRAIEEQLEEQERDHDWANKIEHDFNQTFAEAILENSSIIDMECRTSLCKFEVLHTDDEAAHQFVSTFLSKPDLNLHAQNVFVDQSRDMNGGLNSVYYWPR